ncbi:MAG: L-threonylcarbamoyladenylate synthase [Halocynthiibacter sp.]
MTTILNPDQHEDAAQILREGGLVSVPTETVYGLAADATLDAAVAKIFAAKNRPTFNPLIAHVADLDMALKIGAFSDDARMIADTFWPGPLTIVVPTHADNGLSKLVSAGLETVAIRLPAHPLARAVIAALGHPIAAPSANPSGAISPTRVTHVMDGLGGRIDAILDGGDCGIGVESTIIGFLPDPVLLRPGGISKAMLEAALGREIADHQSSDPITAPGQMTSHYAPKGRVRLNVTAPEAHETFIGFGAVEGAHINLSPSGDLMEAAANLFEALHHCDRENVAHIAVSPIPMVGIGAAINDRLQRAAAPKP